MAKPSRCAPGLITCIEAEKIASLTAKVAELTALNEQLLPAVDRLSRRLFGKSSEQLDPNQLE